MCITLQYIITGIIVLACVVLAGVRIWRTLTNPKSACDGCQLKDACTRYDCTKKNHPHTKLPT